jgi:hypothetical protein
MQLFPSNERQAVSKQTKSPLNQQALTDIDW